MDSMGDERVVSVADEKGNQAFEERDMKGFVRLPLVSCRRGRCGQTLSRLWEGRN